MAKPLPSARSYKRQWRDYRTAGGRRPVKEFLERLTVKERATIYAAMAEVRREGLRVAKHLGGGIWEVKADTADKYFRVLFAREGRFKQVLLVLEVFAKKSGKIPPPVLKLAKDRLKDWRKRGKLRHTRRRGSEAQ